MPAPTPKPFGRGKNAKELKIDVKRKFVVVDAFPLDVVCGFSNGAIVTLVYDDKSAIPEFKNESGRSRYLFWFQLAYADEPAPEPKEEYVPREGDIVSMQFELRQNPNVSTYMDLVYAEPGYIGSFSMPKEDIARKTSLLSRSPRKATRAEVEKLLGGEFDLVD